MSAARKATVAVSPAGDDEALACRQIVVRDADECSQSLAGWHQHYQQLGRGSFLGRLTQVSWDDCALIREATNRHVLERFSTPRGGLVFGIADTVAAGSLFDRRPLTRQTLLVIEGGREHELLAAGEIDMLGLHIGPTSLAAAMDSPELQSLRDAAARGPVVLPPQVADTIRRGLARALQMAGDAADRSGTPDRCGRPLARDQLAHIAFACRAHTAGPAVPAPAPRVASERSRRTLDLAMEFMQAHLTQDIGIDDICRASHASASLLHHSFQAHRRSSAHRCLLAMRLGHARRALKADPGQSITALAHALQFSSSSHFSAQYRAMFGERPSQRGR